MAGCEISSVYAGIAGDHIRSINSKGVIAVSGKDKIITEDDVVRVINAAKAIALPMDREILHVLPQEYLVDDQDGIKNPVGMSGTRQQQLRLKILLIVSVMPVMMLQISSWNRLLPALPCLTMMNVTWELH